MAEYTDGEIRQYIREVVSEAKKTAHVDTGYLKRSIRGALVGRSKTVEFREVFYGQYNDNSKLPEIAQRIMPSDIDYKVIYEDEDGNETTVKGKTRTGRKSTRSVIPSSSSGSTSNIKKLIERLKAVRVAKENKENGET